MRATTALALIALMAGPALAQVPNPKLKNPTTRPPAAPSVPAAVEPETPEKTEAELMQERIAEREAQAMRSICSNCGGR